HARVRGRRPDRLREPLLRLPDWAVAGRRHTGRRPDAVGDGAQPRQPQLPPRAGGRRRARGRALLGRRPHRLRAQGAVAGYRRRPAPVVRAAAPAGGAVSRRAGGLLAVALLSGPAWAQQRAIDTTTYRQELGRIRAALDAADLEG